MSHTPSSVVLVVTAGLIFAGCSCTKQTGPVSHAGPEGEAVQVAGDDVSPSSPPAPEEAGAGQTLATVKVPGSANPWLAGAPDGTRAGEGDAAPAQSPVKIDLPEAARTPGAFLTFAASGGTLNDPGCDGSICGGPDGNDGLVSHSGGGENGIADLKAPLTSLVGVFLPEGGQAPGQEETPTETGAKGLDFETLSATLRAPFFIGDGLGRAKVRQRFCVPASATRLYLGAMDAYDWYNNSGAFAVTITLHKGDGGACVAR